MFRCRELLSETETASPRTGASKYDAHHKVLSQTYGAFADLRRELSDSKTTVSERDDLLNIFATCPDSQRAWLALEDYFEKLSLSRRDFPATDWWPKMLAAHGKARLEELAFLFLRAKRSVPPELQPHASPDRFARAEEAEQELRLVNELENWLSPPAPLHLDTPRATLARGLPAAAGRAGTLALPPGRAISAAPPAHRRKGALAA